MEGRNRNDDMISYLKTKYKSASFKIDLYHLFFERGLQLLKENGKLGFITPSNFLSNNGLVGLRETILLNSTIDQLNIISGKVFIGASVDTTISILSKSKTFKESKFIHSEWKLNKLSEISRKEFNQENFSANEGKTFISTSKKTVLNAETFNLGEKYFVRFGMQLRDRKKFKSDVITTNDKKLITKYHRPCYTGKNVNKWILEYSNLLAFFNTEAKRGGCWDETMHNAKPKIVIRQIGIAPIASLDEKGFCCLNTVFMVIPKAVSSVNLKFILAILNSKFINDYWLENFSDMRQTFPKIKGSYLEKLPIPKLDLTKKDHKDAQNTIVKHVDMIMQLSRELRITKLQNTIEQLQTRIDHCEDQLNNCVFELYGC